MQKSFKFKGVNILFLTVFIFSLLLGCSHFAMASDSAKEIDVLRIGATPGENVMKTREKYKPFVEYLEKKLGMKVELFATTDYAGVIEAMRAGKIEMASFGPLSYVLAADKADAEAFAKEYRPGAGSYYVGYIITHPESNINTIADIKGHSFAFVDPASTGGNLIPRKEMIKNNINPDKDLESVVYLGGHDMVAMAVANKKVDAGSVVNIHYDKMIKEKIITDKNTKVIYKSDPFPGSAMAWRKNLPEDLKDKLKDALLNISEEDYEKLKGFLGKITKYVEAQDSDWDSIRETVDILHIDLSKQ
jgi:phosphonate transport system substrate-binding protein